MKRQPESTRKVSSEVWNQTRVPTGRYAGYPRRGRLWIPPFHQLHASINELVVESFSVLSLPNHPAPSRVAPDAQRASFIRAMHLRNVPLDLVSGQTARRPRLARLNRKIPTAKKRDGLLHQGEGNRGRELWQVGRFMRFRFAIERLNKTFHVPGLQGHLRPPPLAGSKGSADVHVPAGTPYLLRLVQHPARRAP